MKKSLTLLVVFAVLSLNACKKNKQPEMEEKPASVKLLTRIWGTVNYADGIDLELWRSPDYTVDSRLKEQNTVFTYDDQNRLTRMDQIGQSITEYIYKDDLLIKINALFSDGTPLSTSEISYLDGKPKSSKETLFSAPDIIKSETIKNYIYKDDFLTEIQIFSNDALKAAIKFNYENNNISSSNNGNITHTYKYDNKRNPHLNKYLKYLMLYPDFASINNRVETTLNGNSGISQKYIFTYDSEGYPLTKKSVEGDVPITDLHFEYVVK